MTDIIAFCGAGLCVFFALSLVRELRREYAVPLVVAFSAVFLVHMIPRALESVAFLGELSPAINTAYISALTRALGITYLTSISADICHSGGESAVAGYIEGAGKIELLLVALPLMRELLELELF